MDGLCGPFDSPQIITKQSQEFSSFFLTQEEIKDHGRSFFQ